MTLQEVSRLRVGSVIAYKENPRAYLIVLKPSDGRVVGILARDHNHNERWWYTFEPADAYDRFWHAYRHIA
jgi:hypothetical protein